MKSRLKHSLIHLLKICHNGSSLPVAQRLQPKQTLRIQMALIFYALSIGCALLLFSNYASLFTSQKLLNTNTSLLLNILFEPVAYLAGCIYFLTLGMAFMRTLLPICVIALLFLTENNLSLSAVLSCLLMLSAFTIYYFQFYGNYNEFKVPSLSKTLNSSLAIFIIFVSLAISLNYYNGFSARVSRVSDRLGTSISKRFGFIEHNYAIGTSEAVSHDTLRQHVIRRLTSDKLMVTEETILATEKNLIFGLGLASANPNDNYSGLLDRATKRQVDVTINNYRKILTIIVPFAFFFVTDVLANVSSNIAWLLLLATERVFKKRITGH